MPKTVPWKDKEQWFKRYEGGESVAKLTKESSKDPRTVQRGIEEVGDGIGIAQVRTLFGNNGDHEGRRVSLVLIVSLWSIRGCAGCSKLLHILVREQDVVWDQVRVSLPLLSDHKRGL